MSHPVRLGFVVLVAAVAAAALTVSTSAQTALDWVRRRLLGVELAGPTLLRRRGGDSSPQGRS